MEQEGSVVVGLLRRDLCGNREENEGYFGEDERCCCGVMMRKKRRMERRVSKRAEVLRELEKEMKAMPFPKGTSVMSM